MQFKFRAYTWTRTGNAASLNSSRQEGGRSNWTRALDPLLSCTSNDRRDGNANWRIRTDLRETIIRRPRLSDWQIFIFRKFLRNLKYKICRNLSTIPTYKASCHTIFSLAYASWHRATRLKEVQGRHTPERSALCQRSAWRTGTSRSKTSSWRNASEPATPPARR